MPLSLSDQIARGSTDLTHPTLSAYYPKLLTLQSYLKQSGIHLHDARGSSSQVEDLGKLLESAIAGLDVNLIDGFGGERMEVDGDGEVTLRQEEAVDKIISNIFARLGSRTKQIAKLNVLTTGYRRSGQDLAPVFSRPGLDCLHVNSEVSIIRSDPAWRALHLSIGTSFFIDILSTLCIFLPLSNNCYYQLCGLPLSSTKTLEAKEAEQKRLKRKRKNEDAQTDRVVKKNKTAVGNGEENNVVKRRGVEVRTAGEVRIVRNRMFYGKWGYKGGKRIPCCGLPANHILNNLHVPPPRRTLPSPDHPDYAKSLAGYDAHQEARTLLRYIFPREHGLKNAFEIRDEDRDWTGRVPAYTNYVDRSEEISLAVLNKRAKTPKRCKGKMMDLMAEIVTNHGKCDYWKLRATACPSKIRLKPLRPDITSDHRDYITSHRSVCRFARMACAAVLPERIWGSQDNQSQIARYIDTFVTARRYETLSIHQVMQGLNLNSCVWLHSGATEQRATAAENNKRRQMMEELLYWFFDSFLVPLLENTFYVTETASTKYATTYYRMDDWDALCQPLFRQLTTVNLTKLPKGRQNVLRRDTPQHTVLRLLPKAQGLRPICNLGKKLRKVTASGKVYFEKSVNETLNGPFQALSYEKLKHPDILESSLFGMYDVFGKLKEYKARLIKLHGQIPKLYFVKVDVKSAFDSIDQDKLLGVLEEILRNDTAGDYVTTRYSQVLPPTGRAPLLWNKRAVPRNEISRFDDVAEGFAHGLSNAIFIDQVDQTIEERGKVLLTLRQHIKSNLIKVGRDFYSQKVGIPQGSKVSSLLCSFFYGHLERENLAFVKSEESLLVRIIDDFLYVSTSENQCQRFLGRMARGHPEYGCAVSIEKSLASFPTSWGVSNIEDTQDFPYCGMMIDSSDLDVRIDIRRSYQLHVRESLTIKSTHRQGHHFSSWLKRMLENHNHIVYNDTSLSSRSTVISNIYTNFLLAGMKTVHYLKGLEFSGMMHGDAVYQCIDDAITHTCNANSAHLKSQVGLRYKARCSVDRETFLWIAKHAFYRALAARPSGFTRIIGALRRDLDKPVKVRRRKGKGDFGSNLKADASQLALMKRKQGRNIRLDILLDQIWLAMQQVPF